MVKNNQTRYWRRAAARERVQRGTWRRLEEVVMEVEEEEGRRD